MLRRFFDRTVCQGRLGKGSGRRGRSSVSLMAVLLCLMLSLTLITGCGGNDSPSSNGSPSGEISLQTEEASGQELSFSIDETEQAGGSDAEENSGQSGQSGASDKSGQSGQSGQTENPDQAVTTSAAQTGEQTSIDENGTYDQKDDVALYIHTYGHLPSNYITKKEAKAMGWEGGSLERFAPGKCIGGSYFGNYEGLLPEKKGRSYYECDIDTLGKSKRGAKRIIYSTDGLIYYTADHYETFELLYGEE